MRKKRILIITCILCLLLFALLFLLNGKQKVVVNQKKDYIELNFDDRVENIKLHKNNEYLTLGWIQVQGTNIDYPIYPSSIRYDNLAFQNFDYAWQYDTEENYNRVLISGHNIRNVSKNPIRDLTQLSRFESLMLFSYEDFAKENLYIKYTNLDGTISYYKIYAVGFFDNVSTDMNIEQYIKTAMDNSLYNYDIDVNSNDSLLTIYTCTRYYGITEKTQFVVDARLVRENEEFLKYSVSKK